eukprot:6471277-Amphidinium_carterae.1
MQGLWGHELLACSDVWAWPRNLHDDTRVSHACRKLGYITTPSTQIGSSTGHSAREDCKHSLKTSKANNMEPTLIPGLLIPEFYVPEIQASWTVSLIEFLLEA